MIVNNLYSGNETMCTVRKWCLLRVHNFVLNCSDLSVMLLGYFTNLSGYKAANLPEVEGHTEFRLL